MAEQQNPYEFITSSDPGKKPAGPQRSMTQRVAIVAGGGVVFLIIAIIFISLLSKGGENTAPFLKLAQTQQEIARITDSADAISSQSVKNLVTNVNVAVTSDQTQLLTELAARGTKYKAKQLDLGKNLQTDQQLATAKSAGTYDATMLSLLTDNLTTYKDELSQAYNATGSSKLKQQLNSDYKSADLLLTQAKSTQP